MPACTQPITSISGFHNWLLADQLATRSPFWNQWKYPPQQVRVCSGGRGWAILEIAPTQAPADHSYQLHVSKLSTPRTGWYSKNGAIFAPHAERRGVCMRGWGVRGRGDYYVNLLRVKLDFVLIPYMWNDKHEDYSSKCVHAEDNSAFCIYIAEFGSEESTGWGGRGGSFIKTEASAGPRLQDWISWLDPSAARQSFLKVWLACIQEEVTVLHCNMSPTEKVSAACMSSWALSTAWLQLYNWKYSNSAELGKSGIPRVQTGVYNWRTAFDLQSARVLLFGVTAVKTNVQWFFFFSSSEKQ